MQIAILSIGKTDSPQVDALVADYLRRINRYARTEWITLADVRGAGKLPAEVRKQQEGELILRQLTDGDWVVLLDERGAQMRSVELATWMQRRMNAGSRRLCFVIGGPYGFSQAVYARANERLSLSAMTFSHQLVRALFTEQLYRAFTILRGEPYHHE